MYLIKNYGEKLAVAEDGSIVIRESRYETDNVIKQERELVITNTATGERRIIKQSIPNSLPNTNTQPNFNQTNSLTQTTLINPSNSSSTQNPTVSNIDTSNLSEAEKGILRLREIKGPVDKLNVYELEVLEKIKHEPWFEVCEYFKPEIRAEYERHTGDCSFTILLKCLDEKQRIYKTITPYRYEIGVLNDPPEESKTLKRGLRRKTKKRKSSKQSP